MKMSERQKNALKITEHNLERCRPGIHFLTLDRMSILKAKVL